MSAGYRSFLAFWAGGAGFETITTPVCRIFTVGVDDRVWLAPADDRVFAMDAEDRVLTVGCSSNGN
jgi:hypothetical protein